MNKLNILFYFSKKFINNDKLIHTDKNNCYHNHIKYNDTIHKYMKNKNIYECYKNYLKKPI